MKDFLKTTMILAGGLLLVAAPFILDIMVIHLFNSNYENIFFLLIFITLSYVLSFAIDLLIETILKVIQQRKKEENFNEIISFIINFISSYVVYLVVDQLFSSVKLTFTTLMLLSLIHAIIFFFFENKLNSLEVS